LFVTPADRLGSDFFKPVSSSVKVIATYSVGYKHIVQATKERRIPRPLVKRPVEAVWTWAGKDMAFVDTTIVSTKVNRGHFTAGHPSER
jgi:hypothetical protein